MAQRETMYSLLMHAASQTLLTLAHDPKRLGATPAITMVLHTWTRELLFHPHVHAIVSAGGLRRGEQPRWIRGNERYLFPVKVMGKLFRAVFRRALLAAIDAGTVHVPSACEAPMRTALFDKRWLVYAKRPFAGAEHVFSYLGRYTHRVGISNARLQRSDSDTVTFATKNGQSCTLPQVEFLRRLLLHVLPRGFRKIRHYGLASASLVRLGSLEAARSLLPGATPRLVAPAPQTWAECLLSLTGVDVLLCPRCETGRLIRHPLTLAPPVVLDTS